MHDFDIIFGKNDPLSELHLHARKQLNASNRIIVEHLVAAMRNVVNLGKDIQLVAQLVIRTEAQVENVFQFHLIVNAIAFLNLGITACLKAQCGIECQSFIKSIGSLQSAFKCRTIPSKLSKPSNKPTYTSPIISRCRNDDFSLYSFILRKV